MQLTKRIPLINTASPKDINASVYFGLVLLQSHVHLQLGHIPQLMMWTNHLAQVSLSAGYG